MSKFEEPMVPGADASEPVYDYGLTGLNRGFGGQIMSTSDRQSVREFAADMALAYDFEDVDLLYSFLVRMWLLMDVGSVVKLADGKVVVPADKPKFKPTAERLAQLHSCLSEAIAILREAPDNETLAAALHFADADGDMDVHFASLLALSRTSEQAACLEGQSGPRPNADWVREFCIACQRFWALNGRGGTSIKFGTSYPTPITRWVEAVYLGLKKLRGEPLVTSKLVTAAKNLPPYSV